MAASIFEVGEWTNLGGISYPKHSIVIYNNKYYYSLTDHEPSADFLTDWGAGRWGGYITDSNSEVKPYFVWRPSTATDASITPRVKEVQFGNGYRQISADGINNSLLSFNVSFDGRKTNEARAILHFLYNTKGTTSFIWIPPEPFNKAKRFLYRELSTSMPFFNNCNIKCRFEETTV